MNPAPARKIPDLPRHKRFRELIEALQRIPSWAPVIAKSIRDYRGAYVFSAFYLRPRKGSARLRPCRAFIALYAPHFKNVRPNWLDRETDRQAAAKRFDSSGGGVQNQTNMNLTERVVAMRLWTIARGVWLLMIFILCLAAGCQGQGTITPESVRSDMSPELETMAMTRQQHMNNTSRSLDTTMRQFHDDLDRTLLIDQPSRMSIYRVP